MNADQRDLLQKVMTAAHGSAILDAEIDLALFVPDDFTYAKRMANDGRRVISYYSHNGNHTHGTARADDYTSKVDAALRLLKDQLPKHGAILDTDGGLGPNAQVYHGDEQVSSVDAKTLPLALVSAILRAKFGDDA